MSRKLNKLIVELWQLEKDIAIQQDKLNRMSAKKAMLENVDLPEAMTELGSSNFTTDDGYICQVQHKIFGSLPSRDDPDKRYAAIEYLKEHDGAELITSDVTVSFGKGDIKSANRMFRLLGARLGEFGFQPQPIKVDSNVHHSSLAAWGRKRVADNLPTDLGIVGLRTQTAASVKRKD
jgi:hypothetical protein